jgi:hypothetical protein
VDVEVTGVADKISTAPKFILVALKLQLCARQSEGSSNTSKTMIERSILSPLFRST